MLDDRDAATEAAICLCHFEADIPAAEHDQMLRHIVEFHRLDIRKRSGRIEARHTRNCRVCSDIDENPIAHQHARPAAFKRTSSVFGATKFPTPMINSAPLAWYCCKVMHKTRLRPTLKRIDAYVIRWARRKFKRMRHQTKGARDWFDRLHRATPALRTLATMSWQWPNIIGYCT